MSEITNLTNSDNFIWQEIDKDLSTKRFGNRPIITRFPPEPNGYLHIGHAKAIWIDFQTAIKYGGTTNLRFDDTNPVKEDVSFVEAIKNDIKWLGYTPKNVFFASSYFEKMYDCAIVLIKKGLAYVCDLSAEQMREYRGTLTEPGKNSPYRERSVEENLDLFARMRAGEFADGEKTLRAKIDMASPNMNMRDPAIYRISHSTHHQTGDSWCIYPMYDFAHPLEDSFESITHSLCSIEFKDHRPLYEWVINNTDVADTRQIEFARLNLNYTVMSKRYLNMLIEKGLVEGYDDPRMPTIAGLRRRGCPPQAINKFIETIGVSTTTSVIDYALLEHCMRDELKLSAPRMMLVKEPLKLIIDNYEDGKSELCELSNNQENEQLGTHNVTFSKELYIERTDFTTEPAKGYYRFFVGNEVRLRGAYYVTCTGVDYDESGNVIAIHGTYDPETKGGKSEDARKVRGTIHWVSAEHAIKCKVNMYDRLFTLEDPSQADDYSDALNTNSLTVLDNCYVEEAITEFTQSKDEFDIARFQFIRHGYFALDKASDDNNLIFNLTVALKDSFNKK